MNEKKKAKGTTYVGHCVAVKGVRITMDYSLTERQINLPMGIINNEQNGHNGNGNGYTKNLELSNGLCMTNRDPIDLQFKNITYTVNLGFYKGKCIPFTWHIHFECLKIRIFNFFMNAERFPENAIHRTNFFIWK